METIRCIQTNSFNPRWRGDLRRAAYALRPERSANATPNFEGRYDHNAYRQDGGRPAATSEVKDFGKNWRRITLATTTNFANSPPKPARACPEPSTSRSDREIAALDKSKGKAFYRAFLAHEAVAYEKLVKAFKQEAEHGDNPDIKAYANKALPVIESHLHDVQDLRKPNTHKG